MYEKELQFISTQLKDVAATVQEEKPQLLKQASSEKLDTQHVLNFIKFFAI